MGVVAHKPVSGDCDSAFNWSGTCASNQHISRDGRLERFESAENGYMCVEGVGMWLSLQDLSGDDFMMPVISTRVVGANVSSVT